MRSSDDLLWDFAVKIYEPPLQEHRSTGAIQDLIQPLSVVMLLIDFETEVSMNGIVDLLGNSTGLYAFETADALRLVGCREDAAALTEILSVAATAGMTHAAIQQDRVGLAPFTVTTFHEAHGGKWDRACREVQRLGKQIDYSRVMAHLASFIDCHRASLEPLLPSYPS